MTETITSVRDIPPIPEPQKPTQNIKIPSVAFFAVGVILFVFPFVDIQCNNVSLKKLTGIELATGFKVDGPGSDNAIFNGLEKTAKKGNISISNEGTKDPNVYAFVALVAGALGLLISLSNLRLGGIGGLLCAGLAVLSLLGLFVDIRSQLRSGTDLWRTDPSASITVSITPWFYLSLIAFVSAAYFSYRRMKT